MKFYTTKQEKMKFELTAQMQIHGSPVYICLLGCKYHQLRRIFQIHDANHLELYDK